MRALLAWLVLVWPAVAAAQAATPQDVVADRVESVLALRADLDHGRELYARHCSTCHGVRGWGDAAPGIPALAGQRPNYLIKQLADVIEFGRGVPEMHRISSRWQYEDPQALRDLATFLGEMPPNPEPARGNGQRLAEGRRLYESECAGCHGQYAEGANAAYIPALRGQHYGYLRAQMLALATGHRDGMDGEGRDRLRRIRLTQVEAIADFLSRLPSERDSVPDGNPFVPGGE